MSRIPTIPTRSTKENRAGTAPARGAISTTSRVFAATLSDADKRNLINMHTRPMLRNGTNAAAITAPTKRPAIAPARDLAPKQPKVERKPAKVAPKIAPYDYKARFADLLDKHRTLKSTFAELSDTHKDATFELEQLRSGAASAASERDALATQLARAGADLQRELAAVADLRAVYERERHDNVELRRKTEVLAELAATLKQKASELARLEREHAELGARHAALAQEADALRLLNEHLRRISVQHDKLQLDHKESLEGLATARSDLEGLQNILAAMHKEQRELRNTVQDLKGNIRVYCRVRPTLASEAGRSLFNLHVLDACSMEVEKVELNAASASSRKGRQHQSFTFDGIFTPHASQEDVFAEVSPVVQSALDGYNVCIFAYGQTGSGKTYTMEGGCGAVQYGIIPRAFDMVFAQVRDLERMGWTLTIKASFLEIYNENIYDLLDSNKEQESHDIKMVDSKGSDVYVSNLREELVCSSHDFIRFMMQAQRNRQTAATLNNERSSRSHSVTQVRITAVNDKRKEKFTSNLNLVDLAGSESGKTTQRMDETKHINRSLSELSKVILSLQTNQAHVPYRNSKLTYLLMPSLGGNSKTLMLVNVSQLEECFGETLNSLRFATKVNSCRTVKAKKNLTMVDSS